jgi:hypothetical protein
VTPEEHELAACEQRIRELEAGIREKSVRIAAHEHPALRTEAIPVVAALLDWDLIEDEDDLHYALLDLRHEHDYVFLTELLGYYGGSADGGCRSFREDDEVDRRRRGNARGLADAYDQNDL